MKKLLLLILFSSSLVAMDESVRPEDAIVHSKRGRNEGADLLRHQLDRLIASADINLLVELLNEQKDSFILLSLDERNHLSNEAAARYKGVKNCVIDQKNKSEQLLLWQNRARMIKNMFGALAALDNLYRFPQAYFSDPRLTLPSPTPRQVVRHLIGTEREKIVGCMFHFTLFDIANRMNKQKDQSGSSIQIELVTDHAFKKFNCQALNILVASGKDIRHPQAPSSGFESMHHKFMIFFNCLTGKRLLVSGSFNATGNSDKNSWENIMIIEDSKIIDQFLEQFEHIKAQSVPVALADCKTIKRKVSAVSLANDQVPEGSYDADGRFTKKRRAA